MNTTPQSSPYCPRCGYDLSGAVAACNHGDSTSCPMRGTCSECGLEFAWGDVLDPRLAVPPWSYEHAKTRRLSRFVLTCLNSCRPFRMYREIRVETPLECRRLVRMSLRFVVWWSMASWAGWILERGGLISAFSRVLDVVCDWPFSLRTWVMMLDPWGVDGRGIEYSLPLLVWNLWTPVAFLVLFDTLKRHRVRRAHLLRALAYSLPLTAALHWGYFCGVVTMRVLEVVCGPSSVAAMTGEILLSLWIPGVLIASVIWQIVWPSAFVFRYLRIPHALLTVLLLLFVSLLATIASFAYL